MERKYTIITSFHSDPEVAQVVTQRIEHALSQFTMTDRQIMLMVAHIPENEDEEAGVEILKDGEDEGVVVSGL